MGGGVNFDEVPSSTIVGDILREGQGVLLDSFPSSTIVGGGILRLWRGPLLERSNTSRGPLFLFISFINILTTLRNSSISFSR